MSSPLLLASGQKEWRRPRAGAMVISVAYPGVACPGIDGDD
jgi:hypothetical protein